MLIITNYFCYSTGNGDVAVTVKSSGSQLISGHGPPAQ